MSQLCSLCKVFLLDYEIEFCKDNLCSDCCEEDHHIHEIKCSRLSCPNTVCLSRNKEKKDEN